MIQQSIDEKRLDPDRPIKGLDEKLCEFCGEIIETSAEMCPKCGVRLRKRTGRTGLLLLTFFLVVIIGILAAIAIPNYVAFYTRSYNAAAEADLRNAAEAQEAYFLEHKRYAASIEALIGDVYGLQFSRDVKISVESLDGKNYVIVAFHERGNKKYMLRGPNGTIQASPK